MASDLRMTVQSGIRLPPYLGEDKGGVDAAYVSGISASDAFVEKWVAKHLIKTNQVDRFESVTNPVHAAQWGRRMTTSVRKFARHDTYLSFYIPMAYVIGAAAGHLTPMYPTHRKDVDILASHALMADLRKYMVTATGYDEKKRLKEAVAKVQKAINAGQSEPPAPFRDPFVYVSDDRVRTVLDGRQPEPLNVNVDELQSSRSSRAGKEKERRVKRVVRAIILPTHSQSRAMRQQKDLVRAIVLLFRRRKPRPMLGRLQWRLILEGARPSAKAKMTPVPKAEPKEKAASAPEAKNAQAQKAESKETKQADPKVQVKKEKVVGDDAPGGSRGSTEGQKRERKSRWDPDEPVKESTKREASN